MNWLGDGVYRVVCRDDRLALWLKSNPVPEPIGVMMIIDGSAALVGLSWPIVPGAEKAS